MRSSPRLADVTCPSSTQLVQCKVELEHIDPRFAEEAQRPPVGVGRDEVADWLQESRTDDGLIPG